MTSRAQAAWTDGVVGDCGGVDAACKWSTNLPLVALAGHESGLALAYDTNSNGSIQVGFSSHQVFDGVAYYWNSAGIHKLQDPFNIQSIAYAISPNGNYIGGYVAEDTAQNSYINAAVWDANRNLILLKDSVGNRFEGAVLDVSDLGYAVGTTASGKGFIWHPSFDGVQSPYKGAQIFDTWLATIPGSNNTVLSPASKGVEAIAQNKVNGKLLFALSDYEAPGTSYYIETAVTGIASLPEAEALNGLIPVPDNVGVVAFGSDIQPKTITVKNAGLATLSLNAATLAGSGFTIMSNLPSTLAAGASTNLVVKLDTSVPTAKSAIITFLNNDDNENPYNFTLTGSATIPEADVLNGTTAVLDGTGTVAFGNAAKGSTAISKTLTVKNTGLAPLTMSAATLTGTGFAITTNVPASLAANASANLVVRFDTAIAGAKSGTISFANNDSNENPYNFALTGTVTVPEADVLNGTVAVLDGTGTVAFGNAAKGSAAISKTLTVKNTGLAPLTMSAATLTGAGFTIVTNVPTTLAAGATANLVVRLDTAIAGAKSATISFANNDSNENPYNFTLTGTVTIPEADVLNGTVAVLDGTGTVAFGNAAKGSAAISKTLTVKNTGLAPLTMSAATLTGAGFTIVTNVPTTLAAGVTANLVVRLDTAIAGAKSATISFANNDSNENPYNFTLTGTVTLPEADVLNGTIAVLDGTGTVAFGSAAKGSAAISKTLTVKNTGLAPLTMSAATLTGAGFTIVTNVPATLAAGASANLVVRLDTAIAGAKSATISFANNDSNENPYNFTLTGTVTVPEADVLNGTTAVIDGTGTVAFGNAAKGSAAISILHQCSRQEQVAKVELCFFVRILELFVEIQRDTQVSL
jgi:hypothetical protein